MFKWLVLGIGLLCLPLLRGEVLPLSRTHAHNDYEHVHPLMDALSHGFGSVEADIYLVTNSLLVAHELKKVTPENTLERLYLDPLEKQIKKNGGSVYGTNFDFVLMIDIKGKGNETYGVLKSVLSKYQHILTHYKGSIVQRGPVTIVLSGSRPDAALLLGESNRMVALDGKVNELTPEISRDLYPWVSENWAEFFKWRGEDECPREERQKLVDLVAKFHQQGRKVRFWGTPQNELFWETELACGVDYLNVDDLGRAERFLRKRLTTPGNLKD